MLSHHFLQMLAHLVVNLLSLGSNQAFFPELLVRLLLIFVSLLLLPEPQKLNHSLSVDSGVDELSNCHGLLGCDFIPIIVMHNNLFGFNTICGTLLILGLSKFGVDNSKGQVEQEESTSEYKGDEEYPDNVSKALLHVSLDLTPSFKRYALENCQDRVENVIEISDSVVGALIYFGAEVTAWTALSSEVNTADKIFLVDQPCLDGDTPLLEHTREGLGTGDGKNEEEEEQNQEGVLKKRQGGQH